MPLARLAGTDRTRGLASMSWKKKQADDEYKAIEAAKAKAIADAEKAAVSDSSAAPSLVASSEDEDDWGSPSSSPRVTPALIARLSAWTASSSQFAKSGQEEPLVCASYRSPEDDEKLSKYSPKFKEASWHMPSSHVTTRMETARMTWKKKQADDEYKAIEAAKAKAIADAEKAAVSDSSAAPSLVASSEDEDDWGSLPSSPRVTPAMGEERQVKWAGNDDPFNIFLQLLDGTVHTLRNVRSLVSHRTISLKLPVNAISIHSHTFQSALILSLLLSPPPPPSLSFTFSLFLFSSFPL
jgi:hypothetical protein